MQAHVFLESFLSFSIVVRTLIDLWTIRKSAVKMMPVLDENNDVLNLWPLYRDEWLASLYGLTAMRNLLMFNLLESALKQLPKQKVGVYLQENQGWEFGLNAAWTSFNSGSLMGFPHATVRYWDLRYFFDARTYLDKSSNAIPLPDKVACSGKSILETYKLGCYPSEMLVEVESLRYLYLEDTTIKEKAVSNVGIKRLLVLADYLPINTERQLETLASALPMLTGDVQIVLKPHPACPVKSSDYPPIIMNIKNDSLQQLLRECDVVYSSATTSAALDGYCFGLPVITFLDGEDLNLSPLRKRDGVYFVSESLHLANMINEINVRSELQSKTLEYFYIDSALPRWKNLLFRKVKL